jgi:hypothetical protein
MTAWAPQQAVERTQRVSAIIVAWFQIVDEDDDFLICYMLHPETGAPIEKEINVAKPYMLRLTTFDGETRNGVTYAYSDPQTRTASKSGEDDITERITPSFQADDIIRAMSGMTGGTLCADAPVWEMMPDIRSWAESDE